jgi:hypothetical protein
MMDNWQRNEVLVVYALTGSLFKSYDMVFYAIFWRKAYTGLRRSNEKHS